MSQPLIRDYPDAITASQAETALCVFEWLVDHSDQSPYAEMFEDIGWAQMRLNAITTGVWIDRLCAGMEFKEAWDWVVVPFILSLINWSTWDNCSYSKFDEAFPNTEAMRKAVREAFDVGR
ncbi:MAG: hypothetical protein ACREEW_14455 [Caulobacteraceae bacterium]